MSEKQFGDIPPKRKGNPGAGRPKGSQNKATKDVAALAQNYGPDAIKKLWIIAQTSESDAAKVAAIKELLDRAYGKSKQSFTGELDGKLHITVQSF